MQDSRTRVTFVLPRLSPGGAERVTLTLMNGLPRTEFSPSLVLVDGSGELRSLIDPDIETIDLAHKSVTRALPDLARTLRRLKPEIVFSTMAHMNFGVLTAGPLIGGAKIIVREAVTPDFFSDQGARWPMIKACYKWLYPRADLVLSPSRRVHDQLADLIGHGRLRTALLHNPVDVDFLRAQAAGLPPRTDDPTLRLISVGRLHPQKGFDRLIESLAHAHFEKTWHLTIVGEGPQRVDLENLITRHALQEKVTLVGFKDNPWREMAQADVLLLPSRHEGMPNVALEALALGVPVIAHAQAGGIAEIAHAAPAGSVTVVPDMTDMLRALSLMPTRAGPRPRASLLPEAHTLSNVQKSFQDLLRGLAPRGKLY